MNLIIWTCLGLATLPSALALYYTGKIELFQPPTDRHLRNNSYFGYSITYDELNKKLVISAPRENNIGEVYNCNIETRACAPIAKSVERVSSNYTHDYWFGATVKAGPDFVMMCAPRYTEFRNNTYVTYGRCYSYKNKVLEKKASIQEAIRLVELKRQKVHRIEQNMDSFGWSIDVAPDNSSIVGGPGMYHGRVMMYQPDISIPELIRSMTTPFNFGYAVASGTFINNHLVYAVGSPYGTSGEGEVSFYKDDKYLQKVETGTHSQVGSMFGAVLCTAKLYGGRTDLLVGAPTYALKTTYNVGAVFIYIARKLNVSFYKDDKYLQKVETGTHSQVGSMFGAVLCTAKLYGGRTDLLVGAPTYALKTTYNVGAVFIYIARKLNKTPEFHRRIVGQVSGSMFGSAIANVGDLNGDRKPEIAIGAPFENNGHGVVYLYSGADLINELTERDLKCLQKIKPETSYGESFGMSLTALLDYDENGCKELAIGSPYKDTVVLLKCMAAVVVKTSATFPIIQGRTSLNKTDFEFEVCLSVKYPSLLKKITALVSTMVEMDHDYAKLLDTDGTGHVLFNTSLDEKKPEYCKNVSFILPLDGRYETIISYTISSKMPYDPKTLSDFNSSRVILSDRSDLTIRGSLWAAECAGNKTCVPNLELTHHFRFRHTYDDPYIIGSSSKETMHIIVHNLGEVAYESCVRMHIDGANVIKTPSDCVYESSANGNRLKCEPPKPLQSNNTWTTGEIELEMVHLTNMDKTITINMLLFNHCEDVVTQNISIPIHMKADPGGFVAKGETDIGKVVNMTQKDIEQNGKKMQHVYSITNKGPTSWKSFPIQVTLQVQPFIDYGDVPVSIYLSTSNLHLPCPLKSQDETSMSYHCEVESFKKKVDSATILIPMYILPGTLDGLLDKDKNITITSSIKLQLTDDYHKEERITTTITLQDATVPKKWIIMAVIIALCIIIIISLILYKVGFLRRKKREELKLLKTNVKRQTVMRRSTMLIQIPAAEDQKTILDGMVEEDEDDHNEVSP